MTMTTADALTADWLNGWLAALGLTVLLPGTRLGWTDDAIPRAQVDHTGHDLAGAVWEALSAAPGLADLAIARERPDASEMPRNFAVDAFAERAAIERDGDPLGSLAFSATDLVSLDSGDDLPHGPFDVPVPRGITLHQRAVTSIESIDDVAHVRAGLAGSPAALRDHNGLGFDTRRLVPGEQHGQNVSVNPVVEALAFHGLSFFPTFGNGRSRGERGRGWTDRPTRRRAFSWFSWPMLLDRWGIDALLDAAYVGGHGATFRYGLVPYRPNSSSDTTRGYASERLT